MKKKSHTPGLFEITGAVMAFLAGCFVSDLVCNALQAEGYVLIAVLYFSITTAFSWPLMRAGRRLDRRREKPPEEDEDEDCYSDDGNRTDGKNG